MARIKTASGNNRKGIILKNAAALFRKKGFKAASVREIAESLGIEAPSLYNHFGSKTELLKEICFAIAEDFTKHIETVFKSSDSAVKKTESLIRFHIAKMHGDFDRVYVSNHEWRHLPKNELQYFLEQRKAYENKMKEIITQGIKNGELKKIHPYVTVLTILSAVRGLEFWQRHKKEISIAELEAHMVQQLLNGITK